MPPKSREQRLLGAACVRVALERSGGSPDNEIYRGTLLDLGLTEADVNEYLLQHRAEVERRLDAHRSGRRGGDEG